MQLKAQLNLIYLQNNLLVLIIQLFSYFSYHIKRAIKLIISQTPHFLSFLIIKLYLQIVESQVATQSLGR